MQGHPLVIGATSIMKYHPKVRKYQRKVRMWQQEVMNIMNMPGKTTPP